MAKTRRYPKRCHAKHDGRGLHQRIVDLAAGSYVCLFCNEQYAIPADARLTIKQANAVAAGRATVTTDPIDAMLWRVEGDGWTETHEAMAESAWREFLDAKAGRPKTHDAGAGRGRVTVPENPKPEDLLMDAVRDNFSPEAVAAMAAYLLAANTKNRRVNEQLKWFAERLIAEVGFAGYDHLLKEVGL